MLLSGKPALSFTTWNKEFDRFLKAHSAQTHPCAWDFRAGELLRAPVEGERQEVVSMWVTLRGAFPKWGDWIWGLSCGAVTTHTETAQTSPACARSAYIHLCLLTGPSPGTAVTGASRWEATMCKHCMSCCLCCQTQHSFWPRGLPSSHGAS